MPFICFSRLCRGVAVPSTPLPELKHLYTGPHQEHVESGSRLRTWLPYHRCRPTGRLVWIVPMVRPWLFDVAFGRPKVFQDAEISGLGHLTAMVREKFRTWDGGSPHHVLVPAPPRAVLRIPIRAEARH